MGFIKDLLNRFVSDDEQSFRAPGRNEPCWCGSGVKYKKCHLEEDAKKRSKNFGPSCGSA
ncbi:MAG: SEC-C metal-binding domain-containing protein [Nitrospirota bacterium]|jgi:uncharacterized protein YecA (UPF0149 family)